MQSRRFEPDILVLGAILTPLFDEFASSHHSSGVLFKVSGCNPARRVFRVRLDQRLIQHSRSFDVANLSFSFVDDAVEVGQVAFRVHRSRSAGGSGGSRDLQA